MVLHHALAEIPDGGVGGFLGRKLAESNFKSPAFGRFGDKLVIPSRKLASILLAFRPRPLQARERDAKRRGADR